MRLDRMVNERIVEYYGGGVGDLVMKEESVKYETASAVERR